MKKQIFIGLLLGSFVTSCAGSESVSNASEEATGKAGAVTQNTAQNTTTEFEAFLQHVQDNLQNNSERVRNWIKEGATPLALAD